MIAPFGRGFKLVRPPLSPAAAAPTWLTAVRANRIETWRKKKSCGIGRQTLRCRPRSVASRAIPSASSLSAWIPCNAKKAGSRNPSPFSYVLEQHLHRDEALRPGSKSLGLFKGEFTIFRRSDVVNVRSTENWYRTGRVVKSNEIPMKFVKQRAVTIHRRREEELAKMDGGEVDEQPLYAEEQTETYVPPPVVDVSPCCTT